MKAYHDQMPRPAGARIAEKLAFFEFMHSELPAMLRRWRVRRSWLRQREAALAAPPKRIFASSNELSAPAPTVLEMIY